MLAMTTSRLLTVAVAINAQAICPNVMYAAASNDTGPGSADDFSQSLRPNRYDTPGNCMHVYQILLCTRTCQRSARGRRVIAAVHFTIAGIPREQFPRSILVTASPTRPTSSGRSSGGCCACRPTSLFSLPRAYLIGRPAVCCGV